MASPAEGSTLQRALYALGYYLEDFGSAPPGKGGAAPGAEAPLPVEPAPLEEWGEDAVTTLAMLLGTAAAGWLLARILTPRPVRWPRVIAAGAGATALASLARRRQEDGTGAPPGEPGEAAGDALARLAAGVGTAAAFAALFYPRLPGPPLVRGLLFGALEAAAAPAGGSIAMLNRLAPGLRFPLDSVAGLARADGGPIPHLAFGLGLGLLYRGPRPG